MSIDGVGRSGFQQPSPSETAGSQGAGAPAAGTIGTTTLNAQDMQRILREMAGLTASQSAARPDAPTGAPPLAPPTTRLSPEDAVLILQSLQNKLADSQIGTAKEGIKMDADKKAALHQESIKKLTEAAEKLAKAGDLGVFSKILGIAAKVAALVGAIAGIVASVAMIAATGGAATPAAVILLTVSIVSAVGTVADLAATVASEISIANGGPDLSISGMLTSMFTECAKLCGASEEEAKKFGQTAAIVAQVAVAVIMTVASLATIPMTGGASVATTISSIGEAAKVIGAVASIAGAGVQIGGASVNIAKGVLENEAAQATADQLDLAKIIQKLQQQMMENTERVEEMVEMIQDSTSRVASIVSSAGETRSNVVRNMV